METVSLFRIDFDGSEKRVCSAICERHIHTCKGEGEKSARGVMSAYISSMENVAMYSGWDGEVYPQFRVWSQNI